MRVYVASSWRNTLQPDVVSVLRRDGHEVYDFRNPEPGNAGFSWRQIGDRSTWTAETFATEVLDHPVAEHGFTLDMNALEACSACVLVLPCGRSANLELGLAVGQGKLTVVYYPELDEPELMYRMCDYVESSLDGVRLALSRNRPRPRWQRDIADADKRDVSGWEYPGSFPCAEPVDGRGPCRQFHHRFCHVCQGCWRHGACACGPEKPGEGG